MATRWSAWKCGGQREEVHSCDACEDVVKRDSMGLGPDSLTLYCDDHHDRVDLADVDVSGEPATWRGLVRKVAVEGGVEHRGMRFLDEPSTECVWTGQVTEAAAGKTFVTKLVPLRIECPRCRKGRRQRGATLRVRGDVLHALVIDHGFREVRLTFLTAFVEKMRVANRV